MKKHFAGLTARSKTSCLPREGTRPGGFPRKSAGIAGPVPSPGGFFNGLLSAVPWLALAVWLGAGHPSRAADALVWRTDRDEVDAELESRPLPKVLEAIASATGRQIYLEPDTEHTPTTRLHLLQPAEALRRRLGQRDSDLLP